MQALHLVYQHWFVTILLCLFGLYPAGLSLAAIVKAARG